MIVGDSNTQERIGEFYQAAKVFCGLLETAGHLAPGNLTRALAESASRMFAASLRLPAVAAENDHPIHEIDSDLARAVQGILASRFGDHDRYWAVRDPQHREQPDPGSLSVDLVDIYMQIKGGLVAWEDTSEHSISDIVASWRASWEHGWGETLARLLPVLYSLAVNRSLERR